MDQDLTKTNSILIQVIYTYNRRLTHTSIFVYTHTNSIYTHTYQNGPASGGEG